MIPLITVQLFSYLTKNRLFSFAMHYQSKDSLRGFAHMGSRKLTLV